VGGTPYAVNYTYNPDNSLATIQYPSGRVVSQSYDPIGRLATLASGGTNYLSGLSYNAAGQALGFTYGNQVQAAFTYNDHLQLATLRYSMTNKPDLLNLAYDYTTGVPGNNGQIQKIHYYSAPGTEDLSKSENFSYDPWSRLATAGTGDNSTWGLGWNYDRFGNRLNQNVTAGSAPSPSVTVDANTNRINTSGYSYDAAGNMTNDALHTFTYDAENRITTVNTNLATYTYLGALRVKKVAGATSAVYVYSGTKPIQEYENGSLKREYIYAGGGPMLATVTWSGGTSTTTYQHPDHLSIRAESDANGNLIRSTGHFPFGEAWYDTSPGSKWQFTSYERDSESGLDYAMFRSYSSRLGRFMQADLLAGNLGNPESVNRYTYVLNDPEDLVDPLGLLECYLRVIITRDQNGTITEIEALGVWCVGFAGGPRGGNTPEDKKVVQEKQNCANNVLAALNAQRQDYLNGQDKRMLMRMGVGALQGAWTGAKAGAEMGALEGIEGGPPGEGVGAGGGAALGAVIGGIFGAGSAVLVGTPVEIATQYSTGQQFLAETKKDLTSICGVNVQ
jgi:RHS repeat-associated protein